VAATVDIVLYFIFCWPYILLWFLVNDQLDAHFFSTYLFQFSTCFEQPRAHHQENQLYKYNIWYMSLCRWPFGVQVGKELSDLHTKRSPTQIDIYQMYWYSWFSWWCYEVARNMKRMETNTQKRIVRQVGQLPRSRHSVQWSLNVSPSVLLNRSGINWSLQAYISRIGTLCNMY